MPGRQVTRDDIRGLGFWYAEPHGLQKAMAEERAVLRDLRTLITSGQLQAAIYTPRDYMAATKLRMDGRVAVLQVDGLLVNRGWMGTSMSDLGQLFGELVASRDVDAIALDIHSPGGDVFGTSELATQIRQAREAKPVVAVANGLAASAAYWLLTAAGKAYVAPSGQVGSVGIVSVHVDESQALVSAGTKVTVLRTSRHKAEGNPWEPLTDDAREYLEAQMGGYHRQFVEAVATNRGTTAAKVERDFGQGRTLLAKDAVQHGMVDGVATLAEVVANLRAGSTPRRRTSGGAASLRMRQLEIYQQMVQGSIRTQTADE